MQIHELSSIKSKNKKRIGRGGKRGTTSGRGTKGQKSRAGHVIKPALRELVLRIPKRRGFRNKPKFAKPVVLKLADLETKLGRLAEKGKAVELNQATLKQVSLIPSGFKKGTVKVLSGGEISIPLTVGKDVKVSAAAKAKIEKAGGKVA